MATLIRFGTMKGRVALVLAVLGAFWLGLSIAFFVALVGGLLATIRRLENYENGR